MTDAPAENPDDVALRKRTEAIETLARKRYERVASQAAPSWTDAPDMVRYQLMESVNDVVNDVLELLVPTSPDHASLALRMEILAAEIEQAEGHGLLCPLQVAEAIRENVRQGSDWGEAKS